MYYNKTITMKGLKKMKNKDQEIVELINLLNDDDKKLLIAFIIANSSKEQPD